MPSVRDESDSTELATQPQTAGFLTQPRDRGMSPSMLAEQQRAKSEIEAALTIAAHMPRDEKRAMDAILVSCQRPGLAAKSQYEYSRGGTAISGASIVLIEAIAQRWKNLRFGFRELSHHGGRGGEPGESSVEAYAWDLESNVERTVVFTVKHAMKSGTKIKVLTDPRDVYEYIANQAQRRVRTCLENIIPRDVVEAACEECDKTLKASIADPDKAVADMLKAFGPMNVTREMIEGRIQRRIDAITSAQIISLRKIYASIRDGMSEPADWFDVEAAGEAAAKPQTAAEKAKETMRKRSAEKPAEAADKKPAAPPAAEQSSPQPATTREREPGDDDESLPPFADYQQQAEQWLIDLQSVSTIKGLNQALAAIPAAWPSAIQEVVKGEIKAKIEKINGTRGERSNGTEEA